ncbi:MAG: GMC family oxidoreductase [Bryobacterales bacterium]|nr:GMC family oxidoreductase [Bryobacterales bacterium]
MPQILNRSANVYDAVIVGSGCTGGVAAKQLTQAGLKVCVLEAGGTVTEADFSEHIQSYQQEYRGVHPTLSRNQPIQRQIYACRESNKDWFVDDIENPYTYSKDEPFQWIRMRVLGGRSLSWGRQSYRHSDLDFKAASRDGYGMDWPISYKELIPYYEKVERDIGISGLAENLPQLPDSDFLPAMGFSCGEKLLRERVKAKMGRVVSVGRVAILTKEHNGRAACHYCGPCEQGCITYSYYSSPFTVLKDAAATGNLTLVTDAVASHVVMDKSSGRATGVAYIDRNTREPKEVRGKVVLLCASTLESTRLLLNSAPGGLANSSGALGHYLMDHVYHGYTTADFPELPRGQAWTGPPKRPNGLYIPRFRNLDSTHTNGLIRGYGYQGGVWPGYHFGAPGFGKSFKRAIRTDASWSANLHGFVECLPRYENHVSIDPEVTDAWGIPALRISMTWGENELGLWHDAQEQASTMLEAAGAKNIVNRGSPSIPGSGIHEMGTARMGANPKTSVLDKWNQTHDVKNLFVTDGAAFTSVGCQNPTLTMMALTTRCCERIVERGKRGEFA